jgi:hypothetical protein
MLRPEPRDDDGEAAIVERERSLIGGDEASAMRCGDATRSPRLLRKEIPCGA